MKKYQLPAQRQPHKNSGAQVHPIKPEEKAKVLELQSKIGDLIQHNPNALQKAVELIEKMVRSDKPAKR